MSAAEIITSLAGSGGVLVAVGGAGRFVWNKIEARFKTIEGELQQCRRREVQSQQRRGIQIAVIELLWLKVKEFDPTAAVLARAKHLLDELKASSQDDDQG